MHFLARGLLPVPGGCRAERGAGGRRPTTRVDGGGCVSLIDSLINRYAGGDLTQFPGSVQATVRYMGDHSRRKVYHYEYDLDFNVFFGSHYVGRKSF